MGERQEWLLCADIDSALKASQEQGSAVLYSEMGLKALFEASLDAVFCLDRTGRFISANPAALRLTATTMEQLRQRHYLDFCTAESRKPAEEGFRAVLSGRAVSIEVAIFGAEGSLRDLQVSGAPMTQNGKVTGVSCIARDVTEEKQTARALRTSEMRLRLFIENAPASIAMFDRQMRYLAASRRWMADYGLHGDVAGIYHYDVFPELPEEWKKIHQRSMAGETLTCDGEKFVRADGRVQWLKWETLPWYTENGQIGGIMIANEDVTERKRAADALRDREALLRTLTEHARVGIVMVSQEHRYVFANKTYGEVLGIPASEIIGKRVAEVLPEAYESEIRPALDQAFAGERSTRELTVPSNAPGEMERYFSMTYGEPVETANGRCVVVVLSDVTERRRAEAAVRESENRLATVVEHLTEGLIIADSTGQIFNWNTAALQMHGFPSIDPNRHAVSEFVDIFEVRAIRDDTVIPVEQWPLVRIMRGETLREVEVRIRRLDRDFSRVLSYSGSPVRSATGEVLAFLLATDITARFEANEALAAAKESAESASKAKDEFLAALSHELRTPLNPVLMVASAMEDSAGLSEEVREDFGLIRKNVELEARLIDDLLDLTRVARGKLSLRRSFVDAHELLRHTAEIIRGDFEAKEIEVNLALKAKRARVWGDHARLQQVFWNVLKNAVKFTHRHGSIDMRTSTRGDDCLVVEISDSGVGIDPAHLHRIFEAFEQGAPGRSHRFGGLGLGLAISRQIVDLHQGRITAQSSGHGHGATFCIELPLAEDQAAGQQPQSASPASPEDTAAQPLNILLVEDHPITCRTLARLLSRMGYHVSTATDVRSALSVASQSRFDLVISDIGLPDGDGYTLMAKLHERYQLTGIAISGYGMEEDVRRSHESGFSQHLTKPVDFATLRQSVANATTK